MKKKILVRGPALSRSGYGEQTRFALRALQAREDKLEIFLNTTNWGVTSWITENDEEREWIDSLLQKTIEHTQAGGNFDVSLQVTIPGEWERLAPVNIGYTAGVESTKISPQWLEKTYSVNKIIVPSEHTKNVFETTTWQAKSPEGEPVDVGCQTPISVVAFPAKQIEPESIDLDLKTDFNFLTVAQLSPRKNFENSVKWFVEEFHDDASVGLVAKVCLAKGCLLDKRATMRRLEQLLAEYPDRKCKVYLLHGTLSEGQMASLYGNDKIKACVTATHGEGFGLPVFEAAQNRLPVIAPAWSGHRDFLYAPVTSKKTKKTKKRPLFTRVDYELKRVQPEAVWQTVIIPESMWCFPKERSYAQALRKVYENYSSAAAQAKKLKVYIAENFSEDTQNKAFVDALGLGLGADEEASEDVQAWFDELNENVEIHK